MTLMMNAMAKAQIRLLRTHVCFSCCVGLAAEATTNNDNSTRRKKNAALESKPLGGKKINVPKAATLPPTVDVHVAVGAVQVALLRHDDVLDVFHGEVVAEGVVEQPLQLVHRQFLHVALTTEGKRKKKGNLVS